MKRIITGGLLAVALLCAGASAEDAAWTPETFTLDNGMQVVVVPDHRAPVVTHMVWYKVGAVDEEVGKSGLAHLFEHVMFKETENLGPEEFTTIVQRNGGQLNAFTSWDYTAYFERVAKPQLKTMMELEAERMRNLKINDDPKGPFISERDVVKEERRQRIENDPGAILQEQVLSELWKGHPYEITVIGKMEEVAKLSPADGMAFYHKYYSPENAILVVAGDVTAEEVRTLAEETYGQIEPTGTVDGTRKWAPVPLLTENKLLVHSDPKVRQPSWSRYYSGLSESRQRREAYALDVGLSVLGGGMTSRLYQALVEDEQIAINVSTGAWTTLHDEGPAIISASPVDGVSLDELDTAVMTEIRKVLAEGFTDAEVERARNSLAAEAIYARDSQSYMANTFGSTLALGGTIDDILDYPDTIKSITTEEALAAVRKVFGEDRHYIEAELVPAEGDQ
ncbi:MAG: insulinase family protein [Alphaproteobacteria bacterium]|nr:insulinase family protein [Alphaproteobacteria bacterium]MBU2082634.1 insulinase family protein [Alphaproteobacteria bacterium]MBU2142269.1 insulinase family protein [Alphaproteobacteria bacterium]MBU2196688.1 insulinase family protein [Alphaproteobacteria bacterium]